MKVTVKFTREEMHMIIAALEQRLSGREPGNSAIELLARFQVALSEGQDEQSSK